MRGGTRSTAGQNLGAGAVRSLARLTVVLGVCGLACGTAGGALAGQPEQFRYHLVPLDDFFPVKVTNDGKVYGTAVQCSASGCKGFVAVYKNGVTTTLS